MNTIFLSYRRIDSATVAGRIRKELTERFGQDTVFIDFDSLNLGRNFITQLRQTISRCRIVLTVIGPDWLNATDSQGNRRLENPKDVVRFEIETALQHRIPIVPLLVRGASMPEEAELPTTMADFAHQNGIEIRADPDFDIDVGRLIERLARDFDIEPIQPIGGRQPKTAALPHTSPFLDTNNIVIAITASIIAGIILWLVLPDPDPVTTDAVVSGISEFTPDHDAFSLLDSTQVRPTNFSKSSRQACHRPSR